MVITSRDHSTNQKIIILRWVKHTLIIDSTTTNQQMGGLVRLFHRKSNSIFCKNCKFDYPNPFKSNMGINLRDRTQQNRHLQKKNINL